MKNKDKKPHIIVDVERMKHPFTGLYFYCRNLALNLEKYHSDTFNFHFFSYPRVKFPKHLKRIVRSQFDKYYLTKPKKYKIWHATWQDTKYVPRNDMKFVYTIHDLNFLYTDKPQFKKDRLLQAVQDKIDRADAVTVISNFVKEDILKHLDLRGKPVDVIYNGVELNEYPDFDSPKYVPKKKFLFSVGTVLYKKHFHVLPRLLENTDYELVIGGIHPEKSYIKQINDEAKKHHVLDKVHLLGSITDEEKYWYVKNCEAFLFPSISEGFGLPPIEAMLLGKPVFLSTFTSLPEVGGDAAYYFTSFEPKAMQTVLENGLNDYYTNNKKDEIIKWAKQFSWKESVKGYVSVYNRVLGLEDNFQEENSKQKKYPITAIIPTLNEAINIEEAINNVRFADEVLIIDSYSSDDTVAIAQRLGARVIQREFDDFSSQKNYAIDKAKYDWVFVLDADERITPDLKEELIELIQNPQADAYRIKRQNYFAGKKINYSGWQTDSVTRLFNRKLARYNGKIVHEEIETKGKVQLLKHSLDHYTYRDYDHYQEKITHYAALKAKILFEEGKKTTLMHLLFLPLFRFISHYFIRFGFLDGFQGFMIARIQAYGVFVRYNKLWLMRKKIK